MFHDPSYPSEETLSDNQRRLIGGFNDRILSGELAFSAAPCLCGGETFELITEFDRYRAWQPAVICRDCGLVQNQPRLTETSLKWFYESDYFREAYGGANQIPMTDEKFDRILRGARLRFERIVERIAIEDVGSVGEVGCAGGWNLLPFHEAGIPVVGVDFGPHLVAFGRAKGMDLRVGDITAFGDAKFDLLILSHVVEHALDLNAFMTEALRHLNPGGSVYIEVPDIADFCMGAFQTAHIYYFSIAQMNHLCARFGLASLVTRNIGPFFYGIYAFDREAAARVPAPDDYAWLIGIIRGYERRETLKSMLKRSGLFPLCRAIINRIR